MLNYCKRIVIAMAHLDDVEINVAGTLQKFLEEGCEVKIVTLTDSSAGGLPEVRKQEFLESMKVLGVKEDNLVFFDYPDTNLHAHIGSAVAKLDVFLKEFNADMIITHHPADTHQDHVACSMIVTAAGRNVQNILFSQPTWPSGRPTIPFNASVIITFDEFFMLKKIKALGCHKSQIAKYGEELYLNAVKSLNRGNSLMWAGNVNSYAEVFEVNRLIVL